MTQTITTSIRIALAQLNPLVGDLGGNAGKLMAARAQAAAQGANLVLFTELFITGYPPEDLVRKPAFAAAARARVEALAAATADGGPGLIVGTIWPEEGKLYNSIALLDGGRVAAVRHKVDLPNYGVFDEKRYFQPGAAPLVFPVKGVRVGVTVCEDMWFPKGPALQAKKKGAADLHSMAAWENVFIIRDAIEKAGISGKKDPASLQADRRKIRDALAAMKTTNGLLGVTKRTEDREADKPYVFVHAKGNDWVVLHNPL